MNARTIALTERGWDAVNPAQLELVYSAKEEALAIVTEHASDWDKHCVDQVLTHLTETRTTFSANDARDLIPEIRQRKLIGARFNSWRMRGLIEWVGEVTSTDPGTHGKRIGLYRPSLSVLDDQKEA